MNNLTLEEAAANLLTPASQIGERIKEKGMDAWFKELSISLHMGAEALHFQEQHRVQPTPQAALNQVREYALNNCGCVPPPFVTGLIELIDRLKQEGTTSG
jgi:hypothetical protein